MQSERLKKVTLNLYEDDVRFFEERFGYGWSTELRRIMHREVDNYQRRDKARNKLIREEMEYDS
jgi:hypothetical protein